jgi:hypothetical protein
MYAIITTDDGHEVGRSEAFSTNDRVMSMAWVQNGAALAYLQGERLMLLPVEDGQPRQLLEADDQLASLRLTQDSGVVTVRAIQPEEVATETPDAVRNVMYSVNTVTGDSIEFEGWDVRDTYGWELPPTHYLVLSDEWVQDTGPTSYRVVDVLTGKEVGSIEDAALGEQFGVTGMGRHSLSISEDGTTEVIGFGSANLYLIRATGDGAEIRQLPSPPGVGEAYNGTVELFVAPDGSQLSLTIEGDEARTRYLLDLTDPDAEWLALPSTVPGSDSGTIFFVRGTGD